MIVTFYAAASALASLERAVLGGTFLLVMLGVATALRALDAWQRRTRVAVQLDELPAPTTQRLDLSG